MCTDSIHGQVMKMKQPYKITLLIVSAVLCFVDLVAQDTCELFTPAGLKTFHEEHVDVSKGLTPADSLHFFINDESLSALEAFGVWGRAHGFSTAMKKGIVRDDRTLHFIKLSIVFDDLSFEGFMDIVDKVLKKRKELNLKNCGAMGVGHPSSNQ